jgi:multidrug resistance efflux pump
LKYRSKAQRRSPLIIQETVVEQSITIVQNQNLGVISQLAAIAEQELAALVQSQVALVTQLEEVKNNIRINHFKAKFSQVVSPPPHRRPL